jgi:hypothetical protein
VYNRNFIGQEARKNRIEIIINTVYIKEKKRKRKKKKKDAYLFKLFKFKI